MTEELHQFYHDLDSDAFKHLNNPHNPEHVAFWEHAKAVKAKTQIEFYEKPSLLPGVEPDDPDGVIQWKMGSHPKQIEFAKKFFERMDRPHLHETVYSAWGANRSGKTVATWNLCFCKYVRDHAKNGALFWLIAPTIEKSKQGPHKWLWECLPHDMFPKERNYVEQKGFGDNHILELTLPNKRGRCTIVFKTEDQDLTLYESDKVDGVCWTEATREALMRPCLLRCSDKSGFMLIDYLPTHAWHKERLQLNPDYYSMHFCMRDNSHNLPTGTLAKKKKELKPEEYLLSVEGKNRSGFGAVYPQFITEIEPEGSLCKTFKIPDYWPIYLCADWGFRNPHAFIFCTVAPNEVTYVFDEQYDSEMTVPQVTKRVIEILWSHRPGTWKSPPIEPQDRLRWANETLHAPCIIDPSAFQRKAGGEVSIASDFIESGLPMQKGAYSHLLGEAAMVDTVRRKFENKTLVTFESCKSTIRDHSAWRYKQNKDWEPDSKDRFEDKYNHACDAIKYLVCYNPTHNKAKSEVYSPES